MVNKQGDTLNVYRQVSFSFSLDKSVRTITWNVEIVLVAAFSSAFHAYIWGAHSVKPPTQRPSKFAEFRSRT